MAVSLSVQPAPYVEDCKTFDLSGDLRVPLLEAIALQLESLLDFSNPVSRWAGPLKLTPEKIPDIQLDVWLSDDKDFIESYCHFGENVLAQCKFDADEIDPDTWLYDYPKIVIDMRWDRLFNHMAKHTSGLHVSQPEIEFYVREWLINLTHEARHALDFIEHGGGLTAQEVYDLWDIGETELSLSDCVSGAGIVMPRSNEADETRRMEDRVEAKGREWFESMQLPESAMDKVCEKVLDLYDARGQEMSKHSDFSL